MLQLGVLPPQFQEANDLAAQGGERLPLRLTQLTRHNIQDAESADDMAAGDDQRHAGVEAYPRLPGDERVVPKTLVLPRVGDNHHLRLANRGVAEGDGGGAFPVSPHRRGT